MTSAAARVRRHGLIPAPVLRLASDQRLVEQVRAGSERAFEALFDRYHRSLLGFCRHMLGSREDAEDALQQTFLAAYRDLVRSAEPVALRPWLYAIARHRCLSMIRARRERPVEDLPERGSDLLAAEIACRYELRAILADVARLPEDQRAALVLAELGDLSHDDIGQILGCPRNKVKALTFQARTALAASRTARETQCAEIREQLATLRGGSLRRTTLRRHLQVCAGCRAFREQLRVRRRALGLLLPSAPAVGLKRAVLGAVSVSGGGGAGGAVVAASGLSGGGLAATIAILVAVPAGGVAAATTTLDSGEATSPPVHIERHDVTAVQRNDGDRGARQLETDATNGPRPTPADGPARGQTETSTPPGRTGPTAPSPPAHSHAADPGQSPTEPPRAQGEAHPAARPDAGSGADRSDSPQTARPPPTNPPHPGNGPNPATPPHPNGGPNPAPPPQPNGGPNPATPPQPSGGPNPATPPQPSGGANPATLPHVPQPVAPHAATHPPSAAPEPPAGDRALSDKPA